MEVALTLVVSRWCPCVRVVAVSRTPERVLWKESRTRWLKRQARDRQSRRRSPATSTRLSSAMRLVAHTTLLALVQSVAAHGRLSCPSPRSYRDELPDVSWTNAVGLAIPGDASEAYSVSDTNNLNGNIGGGSKGGVAPNSHGLCGAPADGETGNIFMAPNKYGPQRPSGSAVSGGLLEVTVDITAYHAGWFEFRLAVPKDGGKQNDVPITQEMLNEHVLEIDPSSADASVALDYYNMKGYNNNDGGKYKCKHTGNYTDPTATSANTAWPWGTCCNHGGPCSDPRHNTDRYVIQGVGPSGRGTYSGIKLKIPRGIQAERAVLQWTYITANSMDAYPEVFWNCADVAIYPEGHDGTVGCDVRPPIDMQPSPPSPPPSGPSPPPLPSPPSPPLTEPSPPASPLASPPPTTSPPPTAKPYWCSTEWSQTKPQTCTPCATNSDCLTGSCWGQASCYGTIMCGAAGHPECAASVDAPHSPPPSPAPSSPSTTCGPVEDLKCPEEDSYDAFEAACLEFCGSCDDVPAQVCDAKPHEPEYCANINFRYHDETLFPQDSELNHCSCRHSGVEVVTHAIAQCIVTKNAPPEPPAPSPPPSPSPSPSPSPPISPPPSSSPSPSPSPSPPPPPCIWPCVQQEHWCGSCHGSLLSCDPDPGFTSNPPTRWCEEGTSCQAAGIWQMQCLPPQLRRLQQSDQSKTGRRLSFVAEALAKSPKKV